MSTPPSFSVIRDCHHYKTTSLTSTVSEVVKVDSIRLTRIQQQQVGPSHAVVR